MTLRTGPAGSRDGTRTLTLLVTDDRTCHVCDGQRPAVETCAACVGRGTVDRIGYCPTGWDEVHPGLFVGGHYADDGSGIVDVVVRDEFDTVVSLYEEEGHGPGPDVEHLHHRMADADLLGQDAVEVARLARTTADRLRDGKRVLVRCQAGLNRSSLVASLALVELGLTPQEAIDAVRAGRHQNCLFNRSFVDHVRRSG